MFYRHRILVTLLLLLAGKFLPGQAADSEGRDWRSTSFVQQFQGMVAGKYPIVMLLTNWGDSRLTGHYYYERIGKVIELYGSFEGGDNFRIKEYIDGRQAGAFTGKMYSADSLAGVWVDKRGERKLPFVLHGRDDPAGGSPWVGTWYLNDPWDEGRLIIGNVGADSLDFALMVVRGAHLGQVVGRASLQGREAFFSGSLYDEEPCRFSFVLGDGYVDVIQQTGSLTCGFGVRAHANGRFEGSARQVLPELPFGAEEDVVFRTLEQREAFRQSVGEQLYHLFAFNMQGAVARQSGTGDPAGCRAVQGAAIGLYATNQAILMHDDRGHFWGLTTSFDQDDEMLIQYVTNAGEWRNRLPASLQSWYDRSFDGTPLLKGFFPGEK